MATHSDLSMFNIPSTNSEICLEGPRIVLLESQDKTTRLRVRNDVKLQENGFSPYFARDMFVTFFC